VQRCRALRPDPVQRLVELSGQQHLRGRSMHTQGVQRGRAVQRLLRESTVLRQPRHLPRADLLPVASGKAYHRSARRTESASSCEEPEICVRCCCYVHDSSSPWV
jgi:hypothetical protein